MTSLYKMLYIDHKLIIDFFLLLKLVILRNNFKIKNIYVIQYPRNNRTKTIITYKKLAINSIKQKEKTKNEMRNKQNVTKAEMEKEISTQNIRKINKS